MDANLKLILDSTTSNVPIVDNRLNQQAALIAIQQAQIAKLETSHPKNIYILDELQALTGNTELTGWVQPSNAGDTGGSDPSKPHGTFTVTPGKVATFSAKGGYPHNNGYWYTKRKGPQYDASYLYLYELHIMFPDSAALNACEAFELDLQHSINGNIYNFAWQILKPATQSALRKWNKSAPEGKRWEATGLAVPSTPWVGNMIPIIATYRQDADALSYLSLTINGQSLMTGELKVPPITSTESDYLSVGFQLDTNNLNPPTPYKVQVESFRVVYV